MVRLAIGILLVGCLSSTACKSKKDMADKGDKKTTEAKQDSNVSAVTVNSNFMRPKTNPAVSIEKVSIDGNILNLEVSYSGGCEEHAFELISTNMYKKSMPPQLNLYLKHTNNGDACRKLIMDTLQFNIEDVKYPGGGDLVLLISDGNTAATKVTYQSN